MDFRKILIPDYCYPSVSLSTPLSSVCFLFFSIDRKIDREMKMKKRTEIGDITKR